LPAVSAVSAATGPGIPAPQPTIRRWAMSGDPTDHDDDAQDGPGPRAEADDATQADAGLDGGAGATPDEATVQPLGTEPLEEPDDAA
jgi:hypothetical protein